VYKYIQFDILAVDNLKLGKFDRDANNWYSHSYIPGSVIKGAVVWNLVQRKGNIDKKILNGDTVFYNAYPLVDGKNTIPMPQGYIGDKQEIRSNKSDIRLYSSFDRDRNENDIPYNNYEFVIYDKVNNRFKGYNTELIEKLHINKKDAGNENKTLMFRYEAVKKGERFRGFIRADEELADDIAGILEDKVLYFGGSRGSGYGRCEISNIRYVPSAELFESDTDIQDDLYIYFLSDAILYYNGKVHTFIPEDVLKEKLGIQGECKFVSSFINLDKAATYNNMYHTNTVCYTSVSKGSIMKYKINEKINPEKIRELVLNGIGLRKEDGYGQIAVLGKIPDEVCVSEYGKGGIEGNTDIADLNGIVISDEDKELIYSILKKIFYNRAVLRTEKTVIKLIQGWDRNNNYEGMQTQTGKIQNLFQNGIYKTQAEFRQELKEYLDHMKSKRGKAAWHKLRRIVFKYGAAEPDKNKKPLGKKQYILDVQTLLTDFVEGNTNVIFDELKRIAVEGIRLGEFKYPCENEFDEVIYRLQQEFFINLFGQFLRIKG